MSPFAPGDSGEEVLETAEPHSFGNAFPPTTRQKSLHTFTYIYWNTQLYVRAHTDSTRTPLLPSTSKGQCLGPRQSPGVQRHSPHQRACWERAPALVSPQAFLPLDRQLARRQLAWVLLTSICQVWESEEAGYPLSEHQAGVRTATHHTLCQPPEHRFHFWHPVPSAAAKPGCFFDTSAVLWLAWA